MNRLFLLWAPTTIYLTIAIWICVSHRSEMKPIVDKLGSTSVMFAQTYEGLERGEQLSPDGQKEMARIGAHHTHHAQDFVAWTTKAFWWLTLPGVGVALLQGFICYRVGRRTASAHHR